MRMAFFLFLGLMLIALQTAVISGLPPIMAFYDLIIPFVVYFSLFRRFSSGLFVVLIIGFSVDLLSGAPNGSYTALFMVIFLLFRNIAGFFHASEIIFFTFCTAVGVLLENLFFFMWSLFSAPALAASFEHLQITGIQLVWVFLTAPVIYRLFGFYFSRVDRLGNHLLGSGSGDTGK